MSTMKICISCKKEFVPCKNDRHKKCNTCRHLSYMRLCPICNKNIIRHKSKRCRYCQGIIRSGSNNHAWKGGKMKNSNGYVLLRNPKHPKTGNNGYVLEHRLVMEKLLNRYLKPYENIHHLNGIKDDNRIENLELWTRPQMSGIRVKDAIQWAKHIIELYGEDETRF